MDFLGMSEAATSWPEDRAAKLIDLLTTTAAEKTEFSIDDASQADGSYKFNKPLRTEIQGNPPFSASRRGAKRPIPVIIAHHCAPTAIVDADQECEYARNLGSDAILVVSGLSGADDAGLE